MATFEVVLVARIPQSATSPTLTVVDRLIVDNFSYTEELNRPGVANLGCPVRALSASATNRLIDLAANPAEVWIYADNTLVWAGEIQTLKIQGQTLTLQVTGLLGYTYRMGVTSDLTYGGTILAEDFEDTTYNVTPGGTWARSSTTAHTGTWSLRSAAIGNNATTDATFTVPTGATAVQFWYRASSESGFDFFRFLIAGVQQFQASGETGWVQSISYPVTAGQTLTFRYIKDPGTVANLDAAFIDDLTFTGTFPSVDQFTIAKGLVDHWQSQAFGNYGIDTSTVGTSGVTRDRTYLRTELHNIGQRLSELGAVDNGFDMKVDPATRKLVLSYPQSGTDLTASVFLDERNIDSASVAQSVAPGDLASDISATGTGTTAGGTSFLLYSAQANTGTRTAYGRSWVSQNFSGVSVQATLDGHANAYLATRSTQMLQPGVTIVPRVGADVGDFHAGDTISYSYDAGLGLQTTTRRVAKLTVSVSSDGKQRMGVEFL